jgi:thioredoxin reductase
MQQDAIIIGGGFAGLSAAYILGRARRHVTIIDSGTPRNRFAAHSHGVLALDGKSGLEILADARRQLAAYPTVTFIEGQADSAGGTIDNFHVHLAGRDPITARRLLLANGMEDRLPEIPGLKERWGKTVLHCPYCHGYEIGGGPIGVIAMHSMSAHQAAVVADWGDVTLFTNAMPEPDETARSLLERRNVSLQPGAVSAIETGADEMLRVRLAKTRPDLRGKGLVRRTGHAYPRSLRRKPRLPAGGNAGWQDHRHGRRQGDQCCGRLCRGRHCPRLWQHHAFFRRWGYGRARGSSIADVRRSASLTDWPPVSSKPLLPRLNTRLFQQLAHPDGLDVPVEFWRIGRRKPTDRISVLAEEADRRGIL